MTSNERAGLPSVTRLDEIMEAGNKALRGQRWKDALALFESAVTLKPQYMEAWYGKAAALRGMDDVRGALQAYRESLEIDPTDQEVWKGLIETLHEAKMFKEEMEACDCLLRLSPRMDEALLNKGVALHALGKLEKALDCFDQLVARRPENVAALNNKGAVLLRLGRFEDALEAFDSALAQDPQREDVQRNRCLVLLRLGRHSEAVRAADEMLAVREEGWLWMLKGLAHAELKEMPLALESLERAQQLSPALDGLDDALERVRRLRDAMTPAKEKFVDEGGNVEVKAEVETKQEPSPIKPQGVAVVLEHMGFPTESLRIWQSDIDKEKSEDWLGLAIALHAGGERQASERCLMEASKRGGEAPVQFISQYLNGERASTSETAGDEAVRNELGHVWREITCLAKHGRRPVAIDRLSRLLKTRKDLGRGWNWLGILKAESGEFSEARELFRKAADADADYATAWSNLGVVLAVGGNLDEANLALRMALGIAPRRAETLHNLGTVEFRRGNLEEARKLLTQAIKFQEHQQTWFVMANVMDRMSLWRDAARCYKKAMELGCRNQAAVSGLAKARGQLGARKKSKIAKSAKRLLKIKGVGPSRAWALAKAGYSSPAAVGSARIDDLANLPGFNRFIAKSLKKAVSDQKRKKGTSTPASRR